MPGIIKRLLRFKEVWARLEATLFPPQSIFARPLGWREQIGLFIMLFGVFTAAGNLIPPDGFFAFDWFHYWSRGSTSVFYPPWTQYVVSGIPWPVLVGVTLASVSLSIIQRAAHPLSAAAALCALPLVWTVFLGQLEGLVVLGLLGLPWLMPLVLLKPQISIFACGARPQYLLGCLAWFAFSFLIWGWWPGQILAAVQSNAVAHMQPQDVAVGWWTWPLALILFWWSRGDMDMLMAAGAFATLHIIPYNLLPMVPAIARLRPRAALLCCVFSWLPFSANSLGPGGWWLAWVSVGWLWINLAAARYPTARLAAWVRWVG